MYDAPVDDRSACRQIASTWKPVSAWTAERQRPTALLRKLSLLQRRMAASTAPQRRAALSATASNTGCRSVGELLITRRISLVAVCCSIVSARARSRVSQLREKAAHCRPPSRDEARRWEADATCLPATALRRYLLSATSSPSERPRATIGTMTKLFVRSALIAEYGGFSRDLGGSGCVSSTTRDSLAAIGAGHRSCLGKRDLHTLAERQPVFCRQTRARDMDQPVGLRRGCPDVNTVDVEDLSSSFQHLSDLLFERERLLQGCGSLEKALDTRLSTSRSRGACAPLVRGCCECFGERPLGPHTNVRSGSPPSR